jgi:hypothetical protein
MAVSDVLEKTIMAQAEDQYNCAAVHAQMCHLLGFSQDALTNDQYYERFNTRVDVSKSVGVDSAGCRMVLPSHCPKHCTRKSSTR